MAMLRHSPLDKERTARSRLIQILHDTPFVLGSLVRMARTCGKAGCHCADGPKHRHVSLYLAIRDRGKRRMVCIPKDMEQDVSEWVDTYKEMSQLMDTISQACFKRITATKR
jgi:hypothetical protein